MAFALACTLLASARAQTPPVQTPPVQTLPPQTLPTPPTPQTQPGTIAGSVTDVDGDAVMGAIVTLSSGLDAGAQIQTKTDDQGAYTFKAVPPGPFKLDVTADGFKAGISTGTLKSGQTLDVPSLGLIVSGTADVIVTTSQEDLAEAEIKVEEKQRLLGIVPNYFVTYDWHAAPLHAKQKFELTYKITIDPVTVLISEVTAGIEEATNNLSGYGKGGTGFVKRFAANEANVAVGTFAGGYLFPLILKQDPRYFYMGPDHGSIKKRIFYALSTGFITRGDNGKWQPNYSSVLGDLAGGAAANAYYPASDRHGWTTVIDASLLDAAFEGAGNLVQEFLYKRFTPHAPNYPATNQK